MTITDIRQALLDAQAAIGAALSEPRRLANAQTSCEEGLRLLSELEDALRPALRDYADAELHAATAAHAVTSEALKQAIDSDKNVASTYAEYEAARKRLSKAHVEAVRMGSKGGRWRAVLAAPGREKYFVLWSADRGALIRGIHRYYSERRGGLEGLTLVTPDNTLWTAHWCVGQLPVQETWAITQGDDDDVAS